MTRRRARAEALELREGEPAPIALLAARRELGADLREDSLLGVDEALQAEWIAHRTSCRRGAATSRSVGRVMRAEERHRGLEHLLPRCAAREPVILRLERHQLDLLLRTLERVVHELALLEWHHRVIAAVDQQYGSRDRADMADRGYRFHDGIVGTADSYEAIPVALGE